MNMKVFQAIAPNQGTLAEMEIPVPRGDQILVKVAYCGVCGTDYDLFSGNSSFVREGRATYPIRLGHEWSGVVAAVGPEVTGFQKGDRVVGDNYVSCGVCEACRRGDYNNCTGRNHVGTIDPCWPGAFAEYYLAPQRHVYKLADHISLKEATLCEPLSVAYGGTKKMNITDDSVVVVIGTGPIAMSAVVLSLSRGVKVYVVGRNEKKLAVARRLGDVGVINLRQEDVVESLLRQTCGRLADFVLECSGSPEMVNEAIRLCASKATIALVSFYNTEPDDVQFNMLISKEITAIGIMGEYGNLEAVSKLMAGQDLKLREIITGILPLEACGQALMPEDPHSVVKTVIEIAGE